MDSVPPYRPTSLPPMGGAPLRALTLALGLLGAAVTAQAQRDTTGGGAEGLPPAGFGTLRQDDVVIRLDIQTFRIQVLPLDERVTRLLATDTYQSLHRLTTAKAHEVEESARRFGIRNPTIFLITFFGLQARARFDPEILTITSQNRFFRPVQILPLTPLWSGRQLNQRETASAVYLYGDGIQILDPFTVSYGPIVSTVWEQTLRRLDRERASVLAKAAAAQRNP